MVRTPSEQEEYVKNVAAIYSKGPRLWAIECGTWQAIYTEIYIELQLAKRRIEQLEQSTHSFQEQS